MSKIFVVEDEAIICQDIEQTLVRLGYQVAGTALTGVEALVNIEKTLPDLVLMDIKLGGRVDGIQTTAAIRKRWPIPVVYLTSHSDEATLARAKETGPHGYLLKPFEERDLRITIEVALAKNRIEQNLEQRERWYAATLDALGEAIISTDSRERITFMNPLAESLTGWSSAQALGKPLHEVFRVLTNDGEPADSAALPRSQDGFRAELPRGSRLFDRSGRSKDVEDFVSRVVDASGRVVGSVLAFRDITEKRTLERRLSASERLAAIGTLAAGMAHELNNPLAAAVANVDYALFSLQSVEEQLLAAPPEVQRAVREAREALADAATASQRARRVVDDLRKFARADEAPGEVMDLPDVLLSALHATELLVAGGVKVVQKLGTTPLVQAKPGRLEQVFAGILKNAAQAIADRSRRDGRVEIVTRTDEVGRAVVEFSDNGAGIHPEILGRVFDPFFTTRPVGAGMGLGLSIAHTVVSAMGGEISVESQAGRGTTLRIVLPAASPEAPPVRRLESSPPTGPRARVLVIDGDEAVGRTVRRVLQGRHDVFLESDAREALARMGRGEHFDVILCDVSMPNMTGASVYKTIEAVNPELAARIVFVTGGALSDEAARFIEGLPNVIVSKPFTVDALRLVVANRLQR